MSSFKSKKTRLKIKYSNILRKDFKIETSECSTNEIAVCNGGLGNGITQDMVWLAFEKFGEIRNIVMVPGKSYSFVEFVDRQSAVEALETLDDKRIWPEIKGPVRLMYISYLDVSLVESFDIFKYPPGLILIHDFITEEEENFILNLINFFDGENSSELKNRKVKHFGYEFKYTTNNVNLNEPIDEIPPELNFLWNKLKKYSHEQDLGVNFTPDQLTINHYEPGQGIPSHVDTHSAFEDGILSLSLLSPIVMEFKNSNEKCNKVLLPRRSLCIMLGESRYNWRHGITPRKSDVFLDHKGLFKLQKRETRISLTFRKTRKGECDCKYPALCDSYFKKFKSENKVSDFKILNIREKVASELEGNFVHNVYEKIASHFSQTRHKPWPKVMEFISSFKTGSILIDVGCGNGKYFSKKNKCFEIGCDSSNGLMQVCKERGFECFACNCLNIPIRDNAADGCICIAVIHHLTTEVRRKKAIEEIIRILKSKGKALIYVWAKNQEKGNQKSSYLKKYNQLSKNSEDNKVQLIKLQDELFLPVHVNRTNFSYNDLLVPWKLKTEKLSQNSSNPPIYFRFYHVYEDDELKNVCLGLNNVSILEYYYDQGNWSILLEKK